MSFGHDVRANGILLESMRGSSFTSSGRSFEEVLIEKSRSIVSYGVC